MGVIESSGAEYQSAKYAKATLASEAKIGKTTFLIASALGVLPWQRNGGLVDLPSNLHVLAIDSGSLSGVSSFLTNNCGAKPEALQYRVYNLQNSAMKVGAQTDEYSMEFFNDVMATIEKIKQRAKGTPCVLISSLTILAKTVERATIGPPGGPASHRKIDRKTGLPTGKGYSDPSKWKIIEHQLATIQTAAQVDLYHLLWEGHIDKGPPPMGVGQPQDEGSERKETINVPGKAGRDWTMNVEQVFRIRRNFGQQYKTEAGKVYPVDKVYLDTKSGMDFAAGGRSFSTLNAEEPDVTKCFMKLGLKVGGWGAPTKKSSPVPAAAPTK